MSNLRNRDGTFKKGHHKVPKKHHGHKKHHKNPAIGGVALRIGGAGRALAIGRAARVARVARVLVVR